MFLQTLNELRIGGSFAKLSFSTYYYIYQLPSIVCASCLFYFCLSATKVCFLSFFTPQHIYGREIERGKLEKEERE
ncbi:hypothetical protein HanPSC8_Chr06g0237511 [Helianthus annuus]|nr:hypothetical protein HanPSC8_Chr06g0237511 [Helianthus annuus]